MFSYYYIKNVLIYCTEFGYMVSSVDPKIMTTCPTIFADRLGALKGIKT